jgi:hypothetical protein
VRTGVTVLCLSGAVGGGLLGSARLHATKHDARPSQASPVTTTSISALDYTDGVLRTDEGAWTIGRAGDLIATGDWDCDGVATVALLRPATGALYSFRDWARVGDDLVADLLGSIDGATGLDAKDVDGDGCDEVLVDRVGDEPAVVRPPDHL